MVSGLWGVTLAGSFQFVVAMTACVILAVVAVTSVGGLESLVLKAENHFGSHDIAFGIFPSGQETWLPLSTLLIFLSVQWWAAWYPGAEPGGGGYIAQRIMACRDEKQSVLATLWFNIAHYAIRPWPWILVGLVGVLRYPHLQNPEEGYVRAMVDLLPSPFQGLMLAGFVAAYMSAISSHLNWGASYLVNDVYLRFINRTATPRMQILAARVATAILVVLMIGVFNFLGSVEQGWRLLFSLGAGTGAVLILRWYWWRINAWSEISAMAASLVTSVVMQHWRLSTTDALGKDYAIVMATTVAVTTIVWLTVTLLTPPESTDTLNRFYRRVRPGGAGWRTIAKWAGFKEDTVPGGVLAWANWAGGVVGVYGLVFGIGEFLTGSWLDGALCLAAAVAGFLLIGRNLALDESLSASVDTPSTPA
jgi:Na+/proline symporter